MLQGGDVEAFDQAHEQPVPVALMDQQTLRGFGDLCLTLVRTMAAADICALRAHERVSQAVFARYLPCSRAI